MEYNNNNNYDSLGPDCPLLEDDIVVFNIGSTISLRYTVETSYLNCISGTDNEVIFNKLGITDKYEYVSKCYGYKASSGNWPSAKYKDFDALTELVISLFEKCDEFNQKPSKKPSPKPKVNKELSKDNPSVYSLEFIINEVGMVEVGDKIDINGMIHTIQRDHISNEDDFNDKIFKYLNLDKRAIARDTYNYDVFDGLGNGGWPCYHERDMDSAYNILTALYNIISNNISIPSEWLNDIDEDDIPVKKRKIDNKPKNNHFSSTNLKQEQNGKVMQIRKPSAAVRTGKKVRGHTVLGKRSKASIKVGHLGYREILGR